MYVLYKFPPRSRTTRHVYNEYKYIPGIHNEETKLHNQKNKKWLNFMIIYLAYGYTREASSLLIFFTIDDSRSRHIWLILETLRCFFNFRPSLVRFNDWYCGIWGKMKKERKTKARNLSKYCPLFSNVPWKAKATS